jgi:hypothetical protein
VSSRNGKGFLVETFRPTLVTIDDSQGKQMADANKLTADKPASKQKRRFEKVASSPVTA